MGVSMTPEAASTNEVKAEVASDMVYTHLRVLYLNAAVPAKGVVGLSASLGGLLANGHLVEHLYVVEVL